VKRAAAVELQQETMRAVRGLARAAGLNLAVVACPVELVGGDGESASPEMVCGTQAVSDAVSWAASRVYTWHNLPGPGGGQRATDLTTVVPGSGLRSQAAVEEFRAWQEFVSTKGKWVRDTIPALPALALPRYLCCWDLR